MSIYQHSLHKGSKNAVQLSRRGRVDLRQRKKRKENLSLVRAENETRTRDLRITNASLYQLSYFGNRSSFRLRCKSTDFYRNYQICIHFFIDKSSKTPCTKHATATTVCEVVAVVWVQAVDTCCIAWLYLSVFFVALAVVFFSAGFLAAVVFLAAGFLAAAFLAGFSSASAGAAASSAGAATSAFTK